MLLVVISLSIFLIVLFLLRNPPICATARVVAGEGTVKVEMSTRDEDSIYLFAIALCYLAKIRWLILSEPEINRTILKNVFKSLFDNWPLVPAVEMMASLNNNLSRYVINLHFGRSNGWFVTNRIPFQYPPGDLVTHYFFLLREIINKLGERDLEVLRKILYTFINEPLSYNGSLSGLRSLNSEANNILRNVKQLEGL